MIADVYKYVQALPELADIADRHWLGSEALGFNEAPQRIVWVPVTTSLAGGKIQTGPGQDLSKRAIYTAMHAIDVHIWAKSTTGDDAVSEINALELLMGRFLSALRSLAVGSFTVQNAVWSARGSEPDATYGRKLVLRISLQVPVLDYSGGTTLITPTSENITVAGPTVPTPTGDSTVVTLPGT